jgi:hypothetical protein
MKQTFLKFPRKPMRFAPEIISRRMGLREGHFHNAAYRTDGEKDDDDSDEAKAKKELLIQVRSAAKDEVAKLNFQNAEQVTSAVNNVIGVLPLEALRNYAQDKTGLEESIRNIAAKVDQFQQRSANVAERKTQLIIDALNSKLPGEDKTPFEKLELAMRNKGQNIIPGQPIISMNVRAAATMTTGNTIDDTTLSVPVDIIESMSMAEFVPKRRGVQFISDIADRTVLANITRRKTWLEEGTEQGTFAIVAEGAVKPLVSTALVRNFATAKKVAGKYVITEEFAKFYAEAYAIIRRLVNDKMMRDYAAILTTDLNAQAAAYVGTTLDHTKTNPSDYDAIGAVAAQIETLNFIPDVLILHPQDKWRLALETDANGRPFLIVPTMDANGVTNLMGFRVVTSTYQTAGSFTLGESGLFKIEEEPISLRIGYGINVVTATQTATNTAGTVVTAVDSDFDTNRLRVIVETWFNDWLPTPYIGSYVKASFATVKTALLAA